MNYINKINGMKLIRGQIYEIYRYFVIYLILFRIFQNVESTKNYVAFFKFFAKNPSG